MNQDPLSDVLRSVRLRGAVFFYVTCLDPWAAEAAPSRDVAAAVLPGADHVIAYHLIAKGQGWAAMDGEQPVRMSEGDIVMFPRGDKHMMCSAPGACTPPAEDPDWVHSIRNEAKPFPVSYHNGAHQAGAVVPADEASAIVVCGFIGCDLKPFNPLIEALPRLMHLAAGAMGAWVQPMMQQAVVESRTGRAGSAAVLERVSEMMFVDAARRYLESMPDNATGWLAALKDRHVGKAIGLMHEKPAEPWTVDELGRLVGLSRSALHERFNELVGMPPMQYLGNWRMQRGAELLRKTDATVATIAQDVGYESEAAFARAFKRMVGSPPAGWRREQR